MVNVPPIPPLVSSTPPPIDFGDEEEDTDVIPSTLDGITDEEYGDYLGTDDSKSIESLPSPRPPSMDDLTPMSIFASSIPPDDMLKNQEDVSPYKQELLQRKELQKEPLNNTPPKPSSPIVETYNYSVSGRDHRDQTSISKVPQLISDEKVTIQERNDKGANDSESENKYEEKESQSLSEKNNIPPSANIVSIEDLEDDLSEDELYSPKVSKNFTELQDMNNFFAIHEVRSLPKAGKDSALAMDNFGKFTNENNVECTDEDKLSSIVYEENSIDLTPPLDVGLSHAEPSFDDEFGDFENFQDFSSPVVQSQLTLKNQNESNNTVPVNATKDNESNKNLYVLEKHNHSINKISTELQFEYNSNIASDDSVSIETRTLKDLVDSDSKTKSNTSKPNTLPRIDDSLQKNDSKQNQILKDPDSEGDFGDFANFEQDKVSPIAASSKDLISETDPIKEDCEDDDFGDFNTALPLTPDNCTNQTQASQNVLKQSNTVSNSIHTPVNLTDRISKILQILFDDPRSHVPSIVDKSKTIKTAKLQNIPFTSIDGAKALEYQWQSSESRHFFIKSLGIDSRNILYGENWNPSLPRFAANLSFNPLKPIKPATANSSGTDSVISSSCPPVETVSESSKINVYKSFTHYLGTNEEAVVKFDLKSNVLVQSTATEQKFEAFIDNTFEPEVSIPIATASMANSLPYIANETTDTTSEPEKPIDHEEQYSKTPPISEMESVNSIVLSTSIPVSAVDIDFPIANDRIEKYETNRLDELSQDALEVVVASTTFAGSFKETHIFTPPKTVENSSSSTSSTSTTSPSKATSIDFDYEKAAMGVIIDETVVKKEYRDIEYNSPFSADSMPRSLASNQVFGNNIQQENSLKEDDINEEFSDFQSVTSETINKTQIEMSAKNTTVSSPRNPSPVVATNVSTCGMILSPAILIPQAISMESQKPKIEWGDSTSSINPEELARIEELFPEPKSIKSNNSNSSQKSTPTHQANPILVTTPSISAAVANKEMETSNDDDDWTEFVSVPVTNNNKVLTNNNFTSQKTPFNSPFKQKSPVNPIITQQQKHFNNCNNDDEWSDFVSSTPTAPVANAPANQQSATAYRSLPQFNSGAWQNVNFYNNPMSLYHKGPLNLNTGVNQSNAPKSFMPNNNNNYTQYNQFQMASPQQIHVMQNFSTALGPTAERNVSAVNGVKSNQFQVGSAKVAPSIALIPDLGFVAPAVPTHTSFINSLPKPNINTKK